MHQVVHISMNLYTNNIIERYNRTLKTNALKPSDHLVEAIKQLVKHATYTNLQYIKRLTKESIRFMKANLDDCMLIKKYHRELTDNAIRLIRKAHNIVLEFKDIWNLKDEDDSFLFTNPNNDHQSTVSFNHADQMQCNCPWYITERFVCPHMLVILEQRVLPDLQDENKDITDIIAMTCIYKKKQATEIIDHASQFTQFSDRHSINTSKRSSRQSEISQATCSFSKIRIESNSSQSK